MLKNNFYAQYQYFIYLYCNSICLSGRVIWNSIFAADFHQALLSGRHPSPSTTVWANHPDDLIKYYCWWTKSCTTKNDDYPIIYRVLSIPGGAGFLPSTVVGNSGDWCKHRSSTTGTWPVSNLISRCRLKSRPNLSEQPQRLQLEHGINLGKKNYDSDYTPWN